MADAKTVADAGAFAIVIEAVAETLATDITKAVAIPTIGIGASSQCDGQILVGEDMLGMTTGPKPKFVKTYAELAQSIGDAASKYATEVRTRAFPAQAQVYGATTAQQQAAPLQPPSQPVKLELEINEEKPQPDLQNRFTSMVLRARRPAN